MNKQSVHNDYQNMLRNVCGTLNAEGLLISAETSNNLERIASGQISYQQVLSELRNKYAQ